MPRSVLIPRLLMLLALGALLGLLLHELDRCFPGVEFQDPADPALARLGHRLAWAWVLTAAFAVALAASTARRLAAGRWRPWIPVLAAALLLVALEAPFVALQAAHPRALQLHPRRGLVPVPGYRRPPIAWHDARGLRGDGVAVPKPAGTFRVLILGDSTLYGAGASQADTAAALLADHLGVEVVNAAVPGSASADGRWMLERDHLALEPDLVIVGYNNDATPGPPDRDLYREDPLLDLEAFAMERSALVRFLLESAVVARGARPPPTPRATAAEFAENLGALARLGRSHGFRVLLVDMPEDVAALPPGSPGKLPPEYRRALRRVAEETGVGFYGAREEWEPGHPEWFWQDHYHLTPQGHRVLARELARILRERGFVPGGAKGPS